MRMYDIIRKKRSGSELSNEEIEFFIDGYTDGTIPDYQASALLMAICFNGMTDRETSTLTLCMAESGDMIDLSGIEGSTVDKHSTGGVGDKTTLITAPIVAALGGKVAKMSGRGLGHTGGTVDKLESIEGFRTTLSPGEFFDQVNRIGISVTGQSGNLAPADKKLYALRDVTATVDSIPLIASSIMSKKLAAGSKSIVLDVKTGSGAFMKNPEDAELLAKKMVSIGKAAGRNVTAVITDMNAPLGCSIGNSLEVIEAVEALSGKGADDLMTVCCELAAEMMIFVSGKSKQECLRDVKRSITDGSALSKLKEMTAAQGGNAEWIDNTKLFPKAEYSLELTSTADGCISHMDAERIGTASVLLGAGRSKKDDPIDHSAGLILRAKTGDRVKKGDVTAILYTNDPARLEPAREEFMRAIEYSDSPVDRNPIIYSIIK